MSKALKPIALPTNTLWTGKIEVDGKEVFVEVYVKGNDLIFCINKKLIGYDKSNLLTRTLADIGESAVRKYEELFNPKLVIPEEVGEVLEDLEV